jgi:hypothetical protein
MHWTTFAGTERGPCAGGSGSKGSSSSGRTRGLSGTRTLENRLTSHRQTGAAGHGRRRLLRTWRSWRRSGVHRTRTRLRHNHAASGRSGRLRRRGPRKGLGGRLGSGSRALRGSGSGLFRSRHFTADRSGRSCFDRRGRSVHRRRHRRNRCHGCDCDRNLNGRSGRRGNFHGRRNRLRRFDFGRTRCNRLRGDHARRALRRDRSWSWRCGLGRDRLIDNRLRRRRCSCGNRWTRGHRSLNRLSRPSQNRFQRIAWLGDLGEIYFGAELLGGAAGAVTSVRATCLMKVLAYFFGFIGFHGARVSLLFRDANFEKHVENLFAFYFQLASQIVNSNLHPPFVSLCLYRSTCLERCGCAVARSCLERSSLVRRHPCCVCLGACQSGPELASAGEADAGVTAGHAPPIICCPGFRPARPDAQHQLL